MAYLKKKKKNLRTGLPEQITDVEREVEEGAVVKRTCKRVR